jgi:hypothetical protein
MICGLKTLCPKPLALSDEWDANLDGLRSLVIDVPIENLTRKMI